MIHASTHLHLSIYLSMHQPGCCVLDAATGYPDLGGLADGVFFHGSIHWISILSCGNDPKFVDNWINLHLNWISNWKEPTWTQDGRGVSSDLILASPNKASRTRFPSGAPSGFGAARETCRGCWMPRSLWCVNHIPKTMAIALRYLQILWLVIAIFSNWMG